MEEQEYQGPRTGTYFPVAWATLRSLFYQPCTGGREGGGAGMDGRASTESAGQAPSGTCLVQEKGHDQTAVSHSCTMSFSFIIFFPWSRRGPLRACMALFAIRHAPFDSSLHSLPRAVALTARASLPCLHPTPRRRRARRLVAAPPRFAVAVTPAMAPVRPPPPPPQPAKAKGMQARC